MAKIIGSNEKIPMVIPDNVLYDAPLKKMAMRANDEINIAVLVSGCN